MKILVVNWQDRHAPQAGGAEVHLHEIFGRLAQRGHEITLLVSGWDGASPKVDVDGMKVHRVGSRHTFPLIAPPYYRRCLASEGFDLVVEDLNKVPLASPLWAASPVVLLVHHLFGATAFSTASFPVAAVTWLSERPLPHVYGNCPVQVVSESTRDDLVARGFSPDRIAVVHNGIDLDFFRADPATPRLPSPTLLYVGRLQRYKRVDLVIRALRHVHSMQVPARLIVAGRGDEEEALRSLARDEGMTDHIDFVGFVDEEQKRALMRSCWLHVITSPKEGWGLTVMEAAACGTATVASASPGLRDSVVDGVTGVLVPHGDVNSLAEAVTQLLRDRETLGRMGEAARERAETFSWSRSADLAERHLLDCVAHSD